MSKTAELEQEIRHIFNIPRRHKKSRESHEFFLQACSSLDVIGDTEHAFSAYQEDTTEYPDGMLYILAYGFLQSIFLQQDAILNLAESVGLSLSLSAELRDVRKLRNDAVGHPTKRNVKKGVRSFHRISRPTLSKTGFQLISTVSNSDEYYFRDILISDLLKKQSQFTEKLLTTILNHMKTDENSHREKYMNDKLVTVFPPTLGYLFEKVREGISKESRRKFGIENFKAIVGYLDHFEEKLKERGEEECIEHIKADLDYPTEKVMSYLNDPETVDQRAAEIFIKRIQDQYDTLKMIAKEVDEEYEKRV